MNGDTLQTSGNMVSYSNFAELRPIVSRLDGSALPRPKFLSHLSIKAPQAIHFLGT